MEIRTIKIQSAGIPIRQRPCTRWTFVALIAFNVLSLSSFLKYNSNKLITHVVQDDTAVATYTILKQKQNKIIGHVVQDDTAIATSSILPNNSFLVSTKYLFIVRTDNKNWKARSAIRTSWYKDDTDAHHSWGTSIDAKLLFIIEDSQNTMEYAEQDLQFNDTLWIPNSGPRSIESVHFLEVVPTSHYYIIALDTTFINFDNIINYVEKLGRNYMNYY